MIVELMRYNAAKTALAEAHRIDEVKEIRDKAAAVAAYARMAKDTEMIQHATEIKVRAERRAGELLEKVKKNKGASAGGTKTDSRGSFVELRDTTPTLASQGISKKESMRWRSLARLTEEQFEQTLDATKETVGHVSTTLILKHAHKEKKRGDAAKVSSPTLSDDIVPDLESLGGRKFSCVYADPPWRYGNQGTRAATDDHYPTMTVDDICNMPVSEHVADNAHLHLWTTNAFIRDAFDVIEAWGFTYKSCFVWVKPQMGIGNYWRVSHEFLLFGIRGECPFGDRSFKSWIEANRTKHSGKPEVVRDIIEKVSPGPYLEMFGRAAIDGWVVMGNQVEETLFTPLEPSR